METTFDAKVAGICALEHISADVRIDAIGVLIDMNEEALGGDSNIVEVAADYATSLLARLAKQKGQKSLNAAVREEERSDTVTG